LLLVNTVSSALIFVAWNEYYNRMITVWLWNETISVHFVVNILAHCLDMFRKPRKTWGLPALDPKRTTVATTTPRRFAYGLVCSVELWRCPNFIWYR
jgi:hypothetical protein